MKKLKKQNIELRLRPQGDYLHTADWKDLFVLTEHWRSDMDFFRDELRFIENLLAKYFIQLLNKRSLVKLQNLDVAISKLSKDRRAISSRIKKHLTDLGLLMETTFNLKEQQFRDEHAVLEEDIAAFAKNFRKLKKAVFEVSELAMKGEKKQKLLTA